MKIALCGPSGVGKTTLAKYIAEEFNIEYVPGSASLIMDDETRDELRQRFHYIPAGHKNVINFSSSNPSFGIAFQEKLLECRIKKLSNKENFVTDRSPVDNIVYYLTQCSHNATQEQTNSHIIKSILFAHRLTHLINIRVVNQEDIEDNNSRITNKFFQETMDAVFQYVLRTYICKRNHRDLKILEINFWNLKKRKEFVKYLLK